MQTGACRASRASEEEFLLEQVMTGDGREGEREKQSRIPGTMLVTGGTKVLRNLKTHTLTLWIYKLVTQVCPGYKGVGTLV